MEGLRDVGSARYETSQYPPILSTKLNFVHKQVTNDAIYSVVFGSNTKGRHQTLHSSHALLAFRCFISGFDAEMLIDLAIAYLKKSRNKINPGSAETDYDVR